MKCKIITDKIRFFNGDNMRFMENVPNKFYDLVIADPPYRNMSENQPTIDMRANGGMVGFGDKPSKEVFDEIFRVSKEQIIWGANNFILPEHKGFVVWKKTSIGENFTMSMCEYAYISEGLGTIAKMFECSPHRDSDNKFHSTSKPIELYKWLLRMYGKREMRILDPYLGSASIAIACHDFGCFLDGVEINEMYFDESVKRLKKYTSQLSLF